MGKWERKKMKEDRERINEGRRGRIGKIKGGSKTEEKRMKEKFERWRR